MQGSEQTLNRLAVLKAIRRHGPVSRGVLTTLTGLSGGTITSLTADLVERGLVSERRDAGRRMGRPRVQLEIDASAATLVGAKLSPRRGYLDVTFVDLSGRELFAQAVALQPSDTLAGFGESLATGVLETITASSFSRNTITRVGIALPAIVDSRRGFVHSMTTFPSLPFGLGGLLSQRLQMPVTIENDLACMARAEHWFGRAQELATFTLVRVGHSVDLAEYLDGLPRIGASGLNSEIGHVKMVPGSSSRQCFCGAEGCLNTFSSMYGVLSQTDLIEAIPPAHSGNIDAKFEILLERAKRGDEKTRSLLDEAADKLGVAVANYVMTRDPGVVLVAVESQAFLDSIEGRFRTALARNTLGPILMTSTVELILADSEWWQSGMAALALEQTYLRSDGAA